MGYTGLTVAIPCGRAGLRTDDPQSVLDPTDLISAENVNFDSNLIEKDAGASRFNLTAIPSGVYATYDWWPTSNIADRKLVVVGGDGKVYFVSNTGVVTEVTPSGANQVATLSVHNQIFFLAAGQESAGNSRKLFILDGASRPQTITGTATVRVSLTTPAADWTGSNQPKAGFVHRGFVWLFGNANSTHAIYRSSGSDHYDFASASPTSVLYSCMPGEGDSIVGSLLFRGRVFLYKGPVGLYFMDDSDGDPLNWFFAKSISVFGLASPHGVIEALNDMLAKSSSDTLTSVGTTQQFGDIKAGDALELMNVANFIRENTNPLGAPLSHAIYYLEKKKAYFTFRSAGGTGLDRLLVIRLDTREKPKAAWLTCHAPNCLALRRDANNIERPVYGSLDGYVYLMDQAARNVAGRSYKGEFQTPHMDMGFVDARIAGQLSTKNKLWHFLELRYAPQGTYNVYVDVFIDQNYSETLTFPMQGDDLLAEPVTNQSNDFMLSESATDPDGSLLAGEDIKFLRRQLHGIGRTISFKVYNTGLDETFRISEMIVGFAASGQQEFNR